MTRTRQGTDTDQETDKPQPPKTTMENLDILLTERQVFYQVFETEYGKAAKADTADDEREISYNLMNDAFDNINDLNKQLTTEMKKAYPADKCQAAIQEQLKTRTTHKTQLLIIQKSLEKKKTTSTELAATPKIQPENKTAHLPKLKLPTFDGTLTQWSSFWDSIQADVLNTNYADISKFNYIKGQLTGAAEDAVQGILPSGENLKTLTDTLKDQFGQNRKIIRAHVNHLLDIAAPNNTYASIRQFYNKAMGDIRSLENLKVDIIHCAPFIVPIMERKLPKFLREKMGTCGQHDHFDLKLFLDAFSRQLENLGERAETSLDTSQSHDNRNNPKHSNFNKDNKRSSVDSFVGVQKHRSQSSFPPKKCPYCAQSHTAFDCGLSARERYSAARDKNLCTNCLGPHFYKECQNGKRCRTCNRFHHTSLHDHFAKESQNGTTHSACAVTPNRNSEEQPGISDIVPHTSYPVQLKDNVQGTKPDVLKAVNISSDTSKANDTVLLETGKVTLRNKDHEVIAGMLMDRGSMSSYIRKDTAKMLKLQPYGVQTLYVNGFGGHTSKRTYETAQVVVQTSDGSKTIEVLITEEIVKPIHQDGWEACPDYNYIAENREKLANDFQDPILRVDLLIGCDHAFEFLENQLIKGNGPTLQSSNLGYLVSGPLYPRPSLQTHCTLAAKTEPTLTDHEVMEEKDKEIQILEAFLRSSSLNEEQIDRNFDEEFKQEYLSKIQFKDGHYYVPLPWKPDHDEIQNNFSSAQNRLRQVMGRLRKLNLVEKYVQVMDENITKGYVSEISTSSPADTEDGYFLPHFPVFRDSETTPIRIVFDASSGTPSLNSCLYEGPNMVQDLVNLLMEFRKKPIGLSADIARAFLSVRLLERDRKFVKFLWYKDNDINKPVVPYHCNTVIFGNVSSPFALAIALQKHLQAYESPIAKDMLNRLYVDNLLTGVATEEEAIRYYRESKQIMNDGSFVLRQWSTNLPKLDKMIKTDGLETKSDTVGVLGMKWETQADTLHITSKDFNLSHPPTKRTVTSYAASIFDPLGLISPITVPAKAFINKLWKDNLDWDEPLTETLTHEWENIVQNLRQIHEFQIPRWIGVDINKPLDIVFFCDACPSSAIGCVAYAIQGCHVALLGSKNKVVSQKNSQHTVPKLELMAMVMGAQYGAKLQEIYSTDYATVDTTYSTDSEIALYWLRSDKKLKPFLQNRVNAIRKKSDLTNWYHVSSKDNAADVLSRGTTYHELQHTIWLQGPTWLQHEKSTWPITGIHELHVTTSVAITAASEMDNTFFSTCHVGTTSPAPAINEVIDVSRFSSWTKLLRVTALVLHAFKPKVKDKTTIQANDIEHAENLWIRNIQDTHYAHVKLYLEAEKTGRTQLPTRPAIVNQLGLFLDDSNTIRCGGRIINANIDPERKFPILLSGHSYLTTLLIRHVHQAVVHYGTGITMSTLRDRYWIPSMRSFVKKVLNKCVICKKVAGHPFLTPLAPPLPKFRLNDMTPFRSTAVDFTAHLYVKGPKPMQKAYVCLFTCCTTRAVHLEITMDMKSETFIRAFRRFTSTYSVPKMVYCDNAKTFTSADKEIQQLLKMVTSEECQRHFAQKRITFKYTPVQASWFGAVHERMIGVCKAAIKKTLGKALVTIDELQTLVKEIQTVVNNRPLTYVSADPKEMKAITPNNLIYGHDISILPHEEITEDSHIDTLFAGRETLEKMAFTRAKLLQKFRTRFYDEYLANLRQLHQYEIKKQVAKTDVMKVGDVVQVHDKDEPRRKWKLGVIEELHKGQDGLTRSAAVRTATGFSNRAIAKLYPLELNIAPNDNIQTPPTDVDSKHQDRPKRSAASLARDRIVGIYAMDD